MYLNRLPRRVFLRRLAKVAIVAALEIAYAEPVSRDDPRLEAGTLEYGGMRCYVARPRSDPDKLPALVVLHERGGIDPHVQNLARRAALEGFNALAPELAGPQHAQDALDDLIALVDDLAARHATRRIGAIGFGPGGGTANQLAVRSARVAAVASFYAPVPDALDVPRIRARLLLHYAERDTRVNTGVPAFEGALKAAGIPHAIHMYPGTSDAFFDQGNEAAELAWRRTMDFFKDALR